MSRAHVDYLKICVQLPREHADGCASSDKIGDHLHRHLGGEGGYALRTNTVIGRKHADTDLLQLRNFAALPRGEGTGNGFQRRGVPKVWARGKVVCFWYGEGIQRNSPLTLLFTFHIHRDMKSKQQ